MAKQIEEWRGIEGLVCAEVLEDSAEKYETGEVFDIAGVAEISKTTESSNEAHYYDNVPAVMVGSSGSDEVTLTVSAVPLDVQAKITGQLYDETTGALIEGERKTRYFAIGYKAKKTSGTYVYVWRYKGTFGIPDASHVTEDDGTDANGDELTYTGISTTHVFAKTGARCRAINVDVAAEKADVSTFFDTVTTPDTLQAVTY